MTMQQESSRLSVEAVGRLGMKVTGKVLSVCGIGVADVRE